MPGSYYVQMDPDATLDYTLDMRVEGWLPANDTLDSATWTSEDSKLIINSSSHTDTQATVWLETSGAVENMVYRARCRFTSADGREDDRTLLVIIREM